MGPQGKVSTKPSEAQSRQWEHVGLGTAQPLDINSLKDRSKTKPKRNKSQKPEVSTAQTNTMEKYFTANVTTNREIKHPHRPPDPPQPLPPPEPPPGHNTQPSKNPTSRTTTKENENLPPDPPKPLPPPEPPPSVNRNSGRNGNLDAWTSQPQDGQPEQDQIRDEVEEREANLQHHFADTLIREKPEGHIRLTAGNIGYLPQLAKAAKSRHFMGRSIEMVAVSNH